MSASGDIALIRDCAYELAELAMNEGAASKKDVAFECDQIAAALARLEQRETKLSKSLLLAYLHDVCAVTVCHLAVLSPRRKTLRPSGLMARANLS